MLKVTREQAKLIKDFIIDENKTKDADLIETEIIFLKDVLNDIEDFLKTDDEVFDVLESLKNNVGFNDSNSAWNYIGIFCTNFLKEKFAEIEDDLDDVFWKEKLAKESCIEILGYYIRRNLDWHDNKTKK